MRCYELMIFYSPLGTTRERSERNPKPWRSHIHMQCFHTLRVSVPLAYSEDMRPSTKCWEKSLRSKVFHRAELLDGTRDSVLALKNMQCFHMLRRCVGFSWAKPLCYEKSDASPCVHSVVPHMQSAHSAPRTPNPDPRTVA